MSAAADQGEGTGIRPAGEFGMFVFLVSEGLLFGALILAYAFSRMLNPGAFAAGSAALSLPLGTLNTAILLTSSFVLALATVFADGRRDGIARIALAATVLLGLAFLGIKAFEYFDEAQRGLMPFRAERLRDPFAPMSDTRPFFNAYLVLTGTHAVHVLSGMGLLGGIALLWQRLKRPSQALTLAALYWHFIDVIWVFFFPLLYLVGPR